MPFGIRLKKSKQQYNVASKSVYVITVELLDNTMLECTLTSESTGRDCLDNVCQRLGLQQPDLFGLRYVSRRSYPKIRWVDLDRPLKKQLDKYATEAYLYLGVMFYVHDVSLLEDEVTRNHYFLQLKLDVIEGRLRCNCEQAIVLASYSLQAEFGDHDPEKHTLEYLQDFLLLPKPMLSQFPEDKIGTLTDAIIKQHMSLRNIAQQLAEVYYIVGAQQLDGYGQECFLAKDDTGNEVLIGASLTGIVVRKGNASTQDFKWHDITNLVNHKRYFGIECQNYKFSVQFMLDEPDSAKYVWKMCVLQHTFYKMHASAESNELNITLENNPEIAADPQGLHHPHHHPQQIHHPHHGLHTTSQPQQHVSHAQYDLLLEHSGLAPIQHSEIQNFHQQTQRVDLTPIKIHHQVPPQTSKISSVQPQQHHQLILDDSAVGNNTTLQQSYNNYLLHDNLNEPGYGNVGESVEQQQIVPQYRPVPDYETAIRNKYGPVAANNLLQQQQQQQQIQQQIYNSQPSLVNDAIIQQQQQQTQQYNANVTALDNSAAAHLVEHNAYSSTPELNRMNLNHQVPNHALGNNNNDSTTHDQIVAELQRLNLYKPPPPYPGSGPYARLASTSTPDLAGVNNLANPVVGLGGSSPDLVSRRNLGVARNGGLEIHRTFDNLNNISATTASNRDYRNAYSTEELQDLAKSHLVHDVVPNNFVAYSRKVSGTVSQSCNEPIYQNQQQLQEEIAAKLTAEGEPIYQNLPVHEKILYKQRLLEQQKLKEEEEEREKQARDEVDEDQGSIQIDETVESGTFHQPPALVETKLKGHVSRVAITNSREELHKNSNFILDDTARDPSPSKEPKRSVTKISIGGSLSDNNSETSSSVVEPKTAPAAVSSDQQSSGDEMLSKSAVISTSSRNNKSSTLGHLPYSDDGPMNQKRNKHSEKSSTLSMTPRTPNSKPRAGRKRWALNFGSKTGSLKSIKSDKSQDSMDESSASSSSKGFGPMMLATLHGLTRSRPDLLAESMATFSQPSKMPKDEIGAYLQAKLEEGEVLREFERIPKKKLQNCQFNTAILAENIPRSRFKDVLPYDENRVRLTAPDKENKTGFINASHVSASVGPDTQRFYIAAQGPLPNTVIHFWQMIWQCDVHLIVMLTDVSASTKTSSCIPYWPQKSGSVLEVGEFKIVKKFASDSSSAYTTSTLHVTHVPTKRVRSVWHLQYADWSDHGCPSEVGTYLEFLEEMGALRQHTATEIPAGRNRNPPVLVHCSAGVGRTGVTILCDILLHCVDHNLDVDVPKVLTHLRQQRMLMVQTVAQYKFVHTVLIHYLKQSRLI